MTFYNIIFPRFIYAVSIWGIFQIIFSSILQIESNGQFFSLSSAVSLILKITIFGLILYQTYTLRIKRNKVVEIREIEKDQSF